MELEHNRPKVLFDLLIEAQRLDRAPQEPDAFNDRRQYVLTCPQPEEFFPQGQSWQAELRRKLVYMGGRLVRWIDKLDAEMGVRGAGPSSVGPSEVERRVPRYPDLPTGRDGTFGQPDCRICGPNVPPSPEPGHHHSTEVVCGGPGHCGVCTVRQEHHDAGEPCGHANCVVCNRLGR